MEAEHTEETTSLISTSAQNDQQQHKRKIAVRIILASICFERIAYYTFASNIALYLETIRGLCWSFTNGLITSFLFAGVSYVSSFFFGFISDWKLGRAKTAIIGYFLYLTGYITTATVTLMKIKHENSSNSCNLNISSTNVSKPLFLECDASVILPALMITAIGSSAVQSNLAVFGAEQTAEPNIASRFFDGYVVAVNIGAIVTLFATPFTLNNDFTCSVFFVITIVFLVISAILFIIGWHFYRHIQPYDSVLINLIPVIINAFQTRRTYGKNHNTTDSEYNDSVQSTIITAPHNINANEDTTIIEQPRLTFLDFARTINHGRFNDRIVDDVKSLRKALIVFSLLIPYWLAYSQVNITLRAQTYMNQTNIDPSLYIISSIAHPLTVVTGVLILNICVYKKLNIPNRSSLFISKFTIGMHFACITMLLIGTLQATSSSSSRMSVFGLQGMVIGVSEIFSTVAGYEYAYFSAPRSARTLFMSLRFCSIGIASFLGAAYVYLFSRILGGSYPVEVKHGIDFYILGILQFIFIGIFLICQRRFKIIKLDPQDMEED